jgi:hypothetical protein
MRDNCTFIRTCNRESLQKFARQTQKRRGAMLLEQTAFSYLKRQDVERNG